MKPATGRVVGRPNSSLTAQPADAPNSIVLPTEVPPPRADSTPSYTSQSDHVSSPGGEASPWTSVERFAFRTAFSYFAMFAAASLLDGGPAPRVLLAWLGNPIVEWFGHVLLGLEGPRSTVGFGVGWAVAQQIAAVVVAIAAAALWSLVAKRTEYRRLHGWFRIALRYYVAIAMLVYGGFKLIDTQFPPPALDLLLRPVGSLSPMMLLWTYMGASPVYTAFAGLGESLGAFLLFFRRTTTAGALILVAVLSNVALINYAYDVPVKQLSTNLLIAAIILAAADARRLMAVFLLNRPSAAVDTSFPLSPRLARTRRIVKPIIVVIGTVAPLVASFFFHRMLMRPSPLRGVYAVEQFARNGSVATALDLLRWRAVVFDRPGTMTVQLASDTFQSFAATIDTATHRITVHGRNAPNAAAALSYATAAPDVLRLHGTVDRDSVDITLRRLPDKPAFSRSTR